MPRGFHKHKVLLDENMPHRQHLPLLNRHFSVKHIAGDYHHSELPDPQVYYLARKDKRLLITHNIKDFKEFATQSTDTGIIGVSPNLSLEHIDKKLTALLMHATEKELCGKLTVLSGET